MPHRPVRSRKAFAATLEDTVPLLRHRAKQHHDELRARGAKRPADADLVGALFGDEGSDAEQPSRTRRRASSAYGATSRTGFLAELRPALDSLSKERGFLFVFNEDSGLLGWTNPSLDITPEIVKRLDQP